MTTPTAAETVSVVPIAVEAVTVTVAVPVKAGTDKALVDGDDKASIFDRVDRAHITAI